MPRQLMFVAPDGFVWEDYDEAKLQPGQARVRNEFGAAKHGTEMALYKGYARARGAFDREYQLFQYQPAAGPMRVGLGNMNVGRVIEVAPGVSRLAVGDRVLAYGGFRPTQVVHEDRCWKLPEELSWQSAVCLDPADFAFGAVRDGHVRVGDNVAIFGIGAIGLMAVQIARVAGAAKVIAIDPIQSRLELARRFGADLALDPTACDAGLEIKKATDRRGADVVIEYSGHRRAMQGALRGVAYGGTVVAGAFPPPYDAGLDLGAEAHVNIPSIVFTRSCSEPNRDYPRWDERRIFEACLEMLISGRIRGDEVVTPVVDFDEVIREYPRITSEPERFIKLGVRY